MQFELVKIGGKKRPVRYGFWALAEFGEITGLKLHEMNRLDAEMSIKDAIVLTFVGLKDGARKADQEFNYELPDVADWLDEDENAFTNVLEVFNKMQPAEEAPKGKPQKVK